MWYVDPLLGNDLERRSYTIAVVKYRLLKLAYNYANNNGTVFSMRFVPSSYNQESYRWSVELS
jgi:hypothetical protein